MRTLDRLGREVLVAFRPVGYEDWGLVAKMDVDEAYAPVNRLRRLLLAIGGLILALGLAASYLIARQNTRPIRKLAATADAIAGGNLEARIDVQSSDEIGILGQAFTRMTEQLARSHADLEQRIADRTRDLEAIRDLLDAFFRIFTSRLDPENIHRTFDLGAEVLPSARLRPGDDLPGRSRGGDDPRGPRRRHHGRRGRPDGASASGRRHPRRRGPRRAARS